MPNCGTCALCKMENRELQHSHIVSEQFYTEIYTSTHKFKPIKIGKRKQTRFEQKGYREYLLCFDCEQCLALWESELKRFFDALSGEQSATMEVSKLNEFLIVEGFNHDFIKKGLLSILWRMGLSSFELFESYNLGPYSEKIRFHLLALH